MYYKELFLLENPVGNNAITFQQRKNLGSDGVLYITGLKKGTLDDVRFAENTIAYEYVDEKGRLISSYGLQDLVHIEYEHKDIYIIDNHNHAFAMRRRSYKSGNTTRGSHLIHIDQHSDLAEPNQQLKNYLLSSEDISDLLQYQIDTYANEILTIASFIRPAKECNLISGYEMVMTEYSLLHYDISTIETLYNKKGLILDIDLDFRAPEMSIEEYEKTITRVRQLISLPTVGCVTIATSPTYIDQTRAGEVLRDLLI